MTNAMFTNWGVGDRDPKADETRGAHSGPLSDDCRKVRTAQWILSARRLRYAHFSGSLFGEPAWDLLLQVYVSDASGLSSTVAELQVQQEQPASTTLRWLNALEEQGLIRQKQLPTGSKIVELTTNGHSALDAYLVAVQDP